MLCIRNKIRENTHVTRPWKCNESIFLQTAKQGLTMTQIGQNFQVTSSSTPTVKENERH